MKRDSTQSSRVRTIRLALSLALGALAILALPSIAAAKDRNHDRIPDRWEKRHHLSLHVKQTRRDQDGDQLKNLGEFRHGTNPRKADTDGDGINDGTEVEVGDNPADDDTDNDGVEDGNENAGTVASFDGTTLTINLAAGGTVSGQVTDGTEIKCDNEGDQTGHSGSGHGGHDRLGADHEGGGDNPGDDDSGDDNSGDGGGGEQACSVDDLVSNAVVHEASIHVGGDGAVFEEIELVTGGGSSSGGSGD